MIDAFLAEQHLPAPARTPPPPQTVWRHVELQLGSISPVPEPLQVCVRHVQTLAGAALAANAELGRGPDIILRIVTC